ncbi:hypothetical protein BRADI_5g01283v3 [Brachypodium distachyon]|uniref:Uncharacterized protein n=1 Tax=Brachypodium distachyon TaxID=15368 RepID=A0A2K2CET1_BRADI|nr:hypothetical protein BRADI_5g01283v3 [Brachypodium distachyon]
MGSYQETANKGREAQLPRSSHFRAHPEPNPPSPAPIPAAGPRRCWPPRSSPTPLTSPPRRAAAGAPRAPPAAPPRPAPSPCSKKGTAGTRSAPKRLPAGRPPCSPLRPPRRWPPPLPYSARPAPSSSPPASRTPPPPSAPASLSAACPNIQRLATAPRPTCAAAQIEEADGRLGLAAPPASAALPSSPRPCSGDRMAAPAVQRWRRCESGLVGSDLGPIWGHDGNWIWGR